MKSYRSNEEVNTSLLVFILTMNFFIENTCDSWTNETKTCQDNCYYTCHGQHQHGYEMMHLNRVPVGRTETSNCVVYWY